MIASADRANVDEPAASPSRPSARLTALDVPTISRIAQMTHSHVGIGLVISEFQRVNERFVFTCAYRRATKQKRPADASCPTTLARLLSPRLRSLRTLIQSSTSPVIPAPTKATITASAPHVKIWPCPCPAT